MQTEQNYVNNYVNNLFKDGSRLDTTLAVPATAPARVRRVRKVKRRYCQSTGYSNSSLGYFSLWWGRMEMEAMRDVVDKQKESVRCRQEWKLRSMLKSGQMTEVTGYENSITIAETGRGEYGDIYGRLQPDQIHQNCSDNLRTYPLSFETEGGERTHSMGEHLSTGSGGERLSVVKMTNEQTQASNVTDSTEMILGQPQGLYETKMESTSSAGGYEIIGGERKVRVFGTVDP